MLRLVLPEAGPGDVVQFICTANVRVMVERGLGQGYEPLAVIPRGQMTGFHTVTDDHVPPGYEWRVDL